MAKNVLIATLGESPIIVTSMVKALQLKKEMTIDQLHVIHPQDARLIDLGYDMVNEHLKGQCAVTPCPLPFSDANSRETSMEFLQILSYLIELHEHEGDNVYLSLAGGRKNMSALMAVTCQFFERVRGLYHILDKHEGNPNRENFHSIEALYDFEPEVRNEKLSPSPDDLILVEIPYTKISNPVALRKYLSKAQSSLSVSPSIEIEGEPDAFYREILQKEKTDLFDVYLSDEAYEFYKKNGSDRKRLISYFCSMRNPKFLSDHKHDFKGDKTKTDCTCFKKHRTQLRLFYYQTNSRIVVATITGHRSESKYKRIINGEKKLYSKDYTAHIHSNKLEKDSILIVPLGKSPMVVTQTFTLLSKREGANIEKVIVVHPQNAEIRNGVKLLKTAFRQKAKVESIEIQDIKDVASNEACHTYLNKLAAVIEREQTDNPDKSIHLSLSGGRKGMAALTLFAAQQVNIDVVYHTLITDVNLERQIEDETMITALQSLSRKDKVQRLFLDDYDESNFELFRVPVIPNPIHVRH